MKYRRVRTVLCALAVSSYVVGGFVLSVQAQSLKQRKEQQIQSAVLQQEVDYTNQVCGSDISAEVDWDSFEAYAVSEMGGATGSCDAVLSALESLCGDQLSQQAIQERVDQVVCIKGETRDVELMEGTLMFQVQGPDTDDFRYVRDFLVSSFSDEDTESPDE